MKKRIFIVLALFITMIFSCSSSNNLGSGEYTVYQSQEGNVYEVFHETFFLIEKENNMYLKFGYNELDEYEMTNNKDTYDINLGFFYITLDKKPKDGKYYGLLGYSKDEKLNFTFEPFQEIDITGDYLLKENNSITFHVIKDKNEYYIHNNNKNHLIRYGSNTYVLENVEDFEDCILVFTDNKLTFIDKYSKENVLNATKLKK